MTDASLSDPEELRLKSLHALDILDTPLDNRFERVTRLVQNVLKVPIAAFNLVDRDRQWTKSGQGFDAIEITRQKSFCSHAIQSDRVMVVSDARKDDRFAENTLVTGDPQIVFYAGCPIYSPDGERIGALCAIDRTVRQLSARELQTLRDLAGVLESELRLDEMNRKIDGLEKKLDAAERLALIDPLTRLWNRTGIVQELKRAWRDGSRNAEPLAVIAANIDHFRAINDRYGRAAGDDVLREVAKILTATLRANDMIGRIEGDEFLILMPDCPPERLSEVVERIRRETLISTIDTIAGPVGLTLSFGATSAIPREGDEMTSLMAQADHALELAKKDGGNRSEISFETAVAAE